MTEPNGTKGGDSRHVSRRTLLGSWATAASGAAAAGAASPAQPGSQPAQVDAKAQPIPVSPLGKTGVKITRLVMGASFPDYGPRLLTFAYRNGIRCFDNSQRYMGGKAEAQLGQWVNRLGCRDDVFVITKAKLFDPGPFYDGVVKALDRMKLDTIDLFMVHGLEDPAIPLDSNGHWRSLKERLVREKKVRFMGFSTHAQMPQRIACLTNAAKSGWVDAAIVACDPGLIRSNPELDKALGACARAGLGLIAMKTGRGLGKAATQPARAVELFEQLGLSPYQAMQAGMWSDGRFAAVCTEMPNRRIIEENCAGARAFRQPFNHQQRKLFDEGVKKLSRTTCPGCDGSCQRAAGTRTDFCSIARYLAYYDQDGKREIARSLFAELPPELRDWRDADLRAASQACSAKLDFETILARAQRVLG